MPRDKIDTDHKDFTFLISKAYMYMIPDFHRQEQVDLLEAVWKILQDANIKCWIDAGTLLGQIRHKGQILFDDDSDLGVMSEHWFDVLKLVQKFESINELVHVFVDRPKKVITIHMPERCLKTNEEFEFPMILGCPTVELYFYKQQGSDKLIFAGRKARKDYDYEQKYSEVFPLVDCEFNSNTENNKVLHLKRPSHYEKYLNSIYGCDWRWWWTIDPRCIFATDLKKLPGPMFPIETYPGNEEKKE